MTAKMSAARKSAFLAALGASGNLTLAAERAGVSRSWVCKARREDAEFAAACREALAASFDRLRSSGARRPPSGWGHLDGIELVVRGSNARRCQIARARAGQIGPRTERRLLQVLGATCNGAAACAAAGVSKSAVRNHRQRWPAFEARWQRAVKQAWERIECGLIRNGQNLFSATEAPPDLPMPPMTFAQAIHLLHMHKHMALGLGKAPGRTWRPPPTLAALAPGIWRKLEALEREWAADAEEQARDEAEWARRRDASGA